VAAIAVSITVSEMAKGKDLEEANKITNKLVAELTLAIKNYQEKAASASRAQTA
jgi:NifU-like protein involved in Fe-S cluster formation